jgi:ketosteroid isomerase-like protein
MKKLVLLIFVISISSCNNQKAEKMEISNNEKLVLEYFEHFNNHDWEKMANIYTETAEFKDPSLGQGIVKQTREETQKKYSELSAIFPDLKDKVISIYPSGNQHIIVEFISTGTAADQSKFELPICTIFTVVDGKITKDFTYYDNFEE